MIQLRRNDVSLVPHDFAEDETLTAERVEVEEVLRKFSSADCMPRHFEKGGGDIDVDLHVFEI